MIFSNPFVVVMLILMSISLIYANFMDNQPMPERHYNFTSTALGILFNFALIYGAVMWAASH